MGKSTNEARQKHGLSINRLGCSCKLSSAGLHKLLGETGLGDLLESRRVVRINNKSVLIQALDFFFPVSTDPWYQGRISATNVLNDIYTMGVPKILGFSVILALGPSTNIDIAERIIAGAKDLIHEVKSEIVGGHTILATDTLVGGCAMGMSNPSKLIFPYGARAGDSLILTKPLGPQLVMMTAHLEDRGLLGNYSLPKRQVTRALEIMSHPANKVAETIHRYGANAAVDITGFGFRDHAAQMAESSGIDLRIERLPYLKGAIGLAQMISKDSELGSTPETAGGILLSISKDSSPSLEDGLKKAGEPFFYVGSALKKKGTKGKVIVSPQVSIDEV